MVGGGTKRENEKYVLMERALASHVSKEKMSIWFANIILHILKIKCIPVDMEVALIAVTFSASSRNEIIHAEN